MQICCISQQFTSQELCSRSRRSYLFSETLDYMGNLQKRPELFLKYCGWKRQDQKYIAPRYVSNRHARMKKAGAGPFANVSAAQALTSGELTDGAEPVGAMNRLTLHLFLWKNCILHALAETEL